MTPVNFATIGLRLLGVYFLVESVPLFSTAVLMNEFADKMDQVSGASRSSVFSSALFPAISLLVLGILLFTFSVPLARRLIPSVSTEPDKNTCSFADVQAIVFAAVGILVLTNALPSLGRAVVNLYSWYGIPSSENIAISNRVRGDWMYSVGVMAQVVIGLVMLLNPRGFRSLWHGLRAAGTGPHVTSES